MNEIIPQYYKYLILFNGDTSDVSPVLRVSDMAEIKKSNKGRMHLFDDMLVPILSAFEYCLHLPRTEMDTYDTDTEILDNAYDVPQNIFILPGEAILQYRISFQPTLIIYTENCSEKVKSFSNQCNSLLGAVSIGELTSLLLKTHWKDLYSKRNIIDGKRLKDVDKQFLFTDDKQLLLPVLYTARQYEKADDVYSKIFNSTNYFETCADIIWNHRVHHSASPHLNVGEIKKFVIPHPPIVEQDEIVRRVDKLFAIADSIEERYFIAKQKVDKAEKALYTKAFRGEL